MKFTDDKMEHLKTDISKIRVRPAMYISFIGDLGVLHCLKEILNNAIDEVINPRSPATSISIQYYENDDKIIVSDDGRGMPAKELDQILTHLNYGSNINADDKKDLKLSVLGTNGVGTLAYTALAKQLTIITFRSGSVEGNVCRKLIYQEGQLIEDSGIIPCKKGQHGTIIEWQCSQLVLGKNAKIPLDKFKEWLTNVQFQFEKQFKITLDCYDSDNIKTSIVYKTQPFINILTLRNNKKDIGTDIVYFQKIGECIENKPDKNYNRYMIYDIAFAYINSNVTPYIDSFCNGSNTIDGGSHLDIVIECINRYFQNRVKQGLSDKEKEKLDIKWEDIQLGLTIAINFRCNTGEWFTSQTKHKLYIPESIVKYMKDLVNNGLEKYFNDNPNVYKQMAAIIKLNSKARTEGEKIKNSVMKERVQKWDQFSMNNFKPCANKGLNSYKELFIVEGISAQGTIGKGNDPQYQAIMSIRGMPKNIYGLSVNKILENKEFHDLIKIMGCNIGDKFDITKLNYNKIIIATDADADGYQIRSLLCYFFFVLFPEIIKQGRLYVADPPLYKLQDKNNEFITNKKKYIELCFDRIKHKYDIGLNGDMNPSDQLRKFFDDTRNYLTELNNMSKYRKIPSEVLEDIWFYIAENCNKSDDNININLTEKYPEIVYDRITKVLSGVVNYNYIRIILDKRTIDSFWNNIILLKKYGSMIYLIDKQSRENKVVRISQVLEAFANCYIKILHRYKGLGESAESTLWETSLNPLTRTLIKVDYNDINETISLFHLCHGKGEINIKSRTELWFNSGRIIDPDLIDN